MEWGHGITLGMLAFSVGLLVLVTLQGSDLKEEIATLKANEQPDVRALIRSTTDLNERTLRIMDAMERSCR